MGGTLRPPGGFPPPNARRYAAFWLLRRRLPLGRKPKAARRLPDTECSSVCCVLAARETSPIQGREPKDSGLATLYPGPSTQHSVFRTQDSVLSCQFPGLRTQDSLLSTQVPVLSTQSGLSIYSLLSTRDSELDQAQDSRRDTRDSGLRTQDSALAT